MWIWRDALGRELTIYLPRFRDRAEVSLPEPEGCMAFVVEAMRHIDPVKPHQRSALERKLNDLIPRVPRMPLAGPRSRRI